MTMRTRWCAVGALSLSALGSNVAAQVCEAGWQSGFGGMHGTQEALTVGAEFDDGSGPALYLAAHSNHGVVRIRPEGGVDALPGLSGFSGDTPTFYAMVAHDDGSGPALYVAGDYSRVNGVPYRGVVRWRGAGWEPVGSVLAFVYALAEFDEDGDGGAPPRLYAGGSFGLSGDRLLRRWDGQAWTGLGLSAPYPASVAALCTGEDENGRALFLGGSFLSIDGVTANNVVRWDGTSWSAIGNGLQPLPIDGSGSVSQLAWHDEGSGGTLFAGGWLRAAGADGPIYGVGRWDGEQWVSVGLPQGFRVKGLAVGPSVDGVEELVMVGTDTAALPDVEVAARWNGSEFESLPASIDLVFEYDDETIDGVGAVENGVLILGQFDLINGDTVARGVARWDGERLRPALDRTGLDVFRMASAFAVSPEGEWLCVGGDFEAAGGVLRPNVARFDSEGWSGLGEGLNAPVASLMFHNDGGGAKLFAGGVFTASGETDLGRSIAVFDGASWSRFAELNTGEVLALASIGGDLWAGGTFGSVEGVEARRIARWDGEAWHAVGGGLTGGASQVYVVLPWNGGVLAGGSFTNSAGTPMRGVAFWDGVSWSALGDGFNGAVRALAEHQGALYAGGEFTMSGAEPIRYIARWDGVAWRALPGLLSGPVRAMKVFNDGSGESLYVAGALGLIDFTPFGSIARWSGSAWSALDAGLNEPAEALEDFALEGDRLALMVGGSFTGASGVSSYGVAVWRGCLSECPGDANGDQVIDMADLMIVVDAFNTSGGDALFNAAADFDLNGAVDFEDLNLVIAGFNMGC